MIENSAELQNKSEVSSNYDRRSRSNFHSLYQANHDGS